MIKEDDNEANFEDGHHVQEQAEEHRQLQKLESG
jgi:hypothetical protein